MSDTNRRIQSPDGERQCSIPDCGARYRAKGLCAKHYSRLLNHGSPYTLKQIKGNDEQRFWLKVQKTKTCWLWIGGIHKTTGYGQFSAGGRPVTAHRYSFFLHYGYLPQPCCLHSCDTPACVNPAHLRAGTHKENSADSLERHRAVVGERSRLAKRTADDVRNIRQRHREGVPGYRMAKEYGITPQGIYAIVNRQTWKHI